MSRKYDVRNYKEEILFGIVICFIIPAFIYFGGYGIRESTIVLDTESSVTVDDGLFEMSDPIRITDYNYTYLPAIYDDNMCYFDYYEYDFVIYDLDSGEEFRRIDFDNSGTYPIAYSDIYGDYMVMNVRNSALYLHKISTNTTTLLSGCHGYPPCIWEDTVVQGYNATTLMVYDIVSETYNNITNDSWQRCGYANVFGDYVIFYNSSIDGYSNLTYVDLNDGVPICIWGSPCVGCDGIGDIWGDTIVATLEVTLNTPHIWSYNITTEEWFNISEGSDSDYQYSYWGGFYDDLVVYSAWNDSQGLWYAEVYDFSTGEYFTLVDELAYKGIHFDMFGYENGDYLVAFDGYDTYSPDDYNIYVVYLNSTAEAIIPDIESVVEYDLFWMYVSMICISTGVMLSCIYYIYREEFYE